MYIKLIDGSNNLSDYGADNELELASIDSKIKSVRPRNPVARTTTDGGAHDQINFMNFTQQYCVGFIDIINSTAETARIKDPRKLRKYYSLFLNSMSTILNQHNGKIVKNSGDNLFFYFPKTSNHNDRQALLEVFNCSQSMFKSQFSLNSELIQEGLPCISYRISMEYGMVEVALGANNKEVDLFGSVVNECAKINGFSGCDCLSIGRGLYSLLTNSDFGQDFEFKENKSQLNKNNDELLLFYTVFDKRNKHSIENIGNLSINDEPSVAYNDAQPCIDSKNKLYKILIIDDDEDILHTYKSLLKRQEYKVESFSCPVEALKHITEKKSHDYDLVIMDIRMPEVSGIKLFYMFKAIDPYMKILFITALDLVGEFVEALPDINMSEIARKPLSEEQFISIVKTKLAEDIHK